MQFELTPAQRKMQRKARELASGPVAERAAEIDRTEEYPWRTLRAEKRPGSSVGMTIPVAFP